MVLQRADCESHSITGMTWLALLLIAVCSFHASLGDLLPGQPEDPARLAQLRKDVVWKNGLQQDCHDFLKALLACVKVQIMCSIQQ